MPDHHELVPGGGIGVSNVQRTVFGFPRSTFVKVTRLFLTEKRRQLFITSHGRHNMKWITREHVKVDRVACPWLIKKFVDKDAEFFFVPADKVMDEAKRLNATPYDCLLYTSDAADE